MARGKCCYFFIPTGREKRTEFAKKEGRFFKFVDTGEVDAPVFTRVENPGIMGEKHGRGWARMDQTQRALLSTLYERWYGVLHRYAQWAVGDALLAEEIVQETFLAAVPKIEELAAALLSPEEVALLRMVALEKLGHQAAAERLGLSLWSCQKRMQRIRKKLRAQRRKLEGGTP